MEQYFEALETVISMRVEDQLRPLIDSVAQMNELLQTFNNRIQCLEQIALQGVADKPQKRARRNVAEPVAPPPHPAVHLLENYLDTSGRVTFDPTYWMPEDKFLEVFSQYCRQLDDATWPRWCADFYYNTFRKRGIKTEELACAETYHGVNLRRGTRVVRGVDLVSNLNNNSM